MQPDKKESKLHLVFMWGGLLLVVLGLFMPFIIAIYKPKFLWLVGHDTLGSDPLGTTGDWFGGTLTPIFTLAGNVLFFSAILMQRAELKLQREELKLQRDELKDTRGEFEKQNKTMALQRFESTFFHMISVYHDVVEKYRYQILTVLKLGKLHLNGLLKYWVPIMAISQ